MGQQNVDLTTPEIAALWTTYIQNSAAICFCHHFLRHMQDMEIKPIVEETLVLLHIYNKEITAIFNKEEFPIPKGFSEKDVDLSVQPLFSDLFALSFVYRFGQINVEYFGSILTKVARPDVLQFFDEALSTIVQLFKKSLNLMLSKGVYDRPPKIPYPRKVEYVEKEPSLFETWLGEKRPLNVLELGEIFYTIERNYIGLLLLVGLIQVTKDKKIKEYLLNGKRLAEKQVEILNKVLKDDEHIGSIPVSMEVTDSTVSPFSDRLILFLISTTTSTGISLLGYALSVSTRKDLATYYVKLMADIMNYGREGLNLLIQRGWMEQPPQAINRSKLYET